MLHTGGHCYPIPQPSSPTGSTLHFCEAQLENDIEETFESLSTADLEQPFPFRRQVQVPLTKPTYVKSQSAEIVALPFMPSGKRSECVDNASTCKQAKHTTQQYNKVGQIDFEQSDASEAYNASSSDRDSISLTSAPPETSLQIQVKTTPDEKPLTGQWLSSPWFTSGTEEAPYTASNTPTPHNSKPKGWRALSAKIPILWVWMLDDLYWWALLTFIVGSACFTVAGVCDSWPWSPYWCPLISSTISVTGTIFYQTGCYLGILESINYRGSAYEANDDDEEIEIENGMRNTQPWNDKSCLSEELKCPCPFDTNGKIKIVQPLIHDRFWWWGHNWNSWFWWSWYAFFIAGPLYFVPGILAIPGVVPAGFVSSHPKLWDNIMGGLLTIGGLLFMVGSVAGQMDIQGNQVFNVEIHNLAWWGLMLFNPGSVLFLISAGCTWAGTAPFWGQAFCSFIGSVVYTVSSYMLLIAHNERKHKMELKILAKWERSKK